MKQIMQQHTSLLLIDSVYGGRNSSHTQLCSKSDLMVFSLSSFREQGDVLIRSCLTNLSKSWQKQTASWVSYLFEISTSMIMRGETNHRQKSDKWNENDLAKRTPVFGCSRFCWLFERSQNSFCTKNYWNQRWRQWATTKPSKIATMSSSLWAN